MPSSTGTGTEDDPVIEEVEDIGFSSSINEREQRQQMRMQDQTMGGTGGQPGMGGMPPNMADMMNNPMVQEMMKNPEMIKMAQ